MGIYVFIIYCKVYMYTHAQTCKTSRTAGFPALEPFTPTPEKNLGASNSEGPNPKP